VDHVIWLGNNNASPRKRKRNGAPIELIIGKSIEWWNEQHRNGPDEALGNWERRKIISIVDGYVRLHLTNTHIDQDVWVEVDDERLRAVVVMENIQPTLAVVGAVLPLAGDMGLMDSPLEVGTATTTTTNNNTASSLPESA
jgi:hypothetical protein